MATIPTYRKILGEKIRFYRKLSKFSQEKLAEMADLHPKYVSEVERGGKTISVDALHRIAKALGISMRDLFRDL